MQKATNAKIAIYPYTALCKKYGVELQAIILFLPFILCYLHPIKRLPQQALMDIHDPINQSPHWGASSRVQLHLLLFLFG
ncbi:MAG: hypothetical protein ACLFUS_06720 [Candidatus Sumerlaeia bacterium]